jgi:hypothetical protein
MKDVERQLRLVGEFQIQCVLVGGVAATVHGSSIPTQDLDICYSRDSTNVTKVVQALRSVNAILRGAPKNIPFILDEETLQRGLNFTFDTDVGKLDLLGEVRGVGVYVDCVENADEAELFGYSQRALSGKTNRRKANCWTTQRSDCSARAGSNPRAQKKQRPLKQ